MPIYEYQCQECGFQLDKLQKVTDAPLLTCPECNSDSLKRLVSAAGFRLKGSGWYETDFKTDKDKKKNLADTSQTTNTSDNKVSTGKTKKAKKKVANSNTTKSQAT